MPELSPAAQAVLNEHSKVAYDDEIEQSFMPLPWERKAVAAALRAAANQIAPKTLPPKFASHYEEGVWDGKDDARDQLLALAAELDHDDQG